MSAPKIVRCRSCDARIFFVWSPADRTFPLDELQVPFEAIPPRAVPYDVDFDEHPLRATIAHKGLVFLSHFVTCPNAASHSKKRPKAQGDARG